MTDSDAILNSFASDATVNPESVRGEGARHRRQSLPRITWTAAKVHPESFRGQPSAEVQIVVP